MDVNPELIAVASESVTLADGNIYEQIYLDMRQDTPNCQSVQTEQFSNTTDGSLNVIYEQETQVSPDPLVYSLKEETNRILNTNATEDESMAVEALRQLGSSAVYTKIPQDLPLLTCSNCETQFRTTADFQNHAGICKHSQLKCYICNEMFEKTIDFNNHLVCHAVERPHSCRICGTLFIHEKDFTEHLHTHGTAVNVNQCKVCGIVFNRPSSLTNHMKIHNYQPGRAILNSFVLPKAEDHLSCDDIATSNDIVTSKNMLPSLNSITNVNNWEDYDLTQEGLNSEVNFEVAQEMTIGSFEDDKNIVSITYEYVNDDDIKYQEEEICDMVEAAPLNDVSENKINNHNSKKPHACNYCNKRFAREKALISHLKLHSNVLEMYYRCKNCDEYLTDEESLAKHTSNCNEKLQKNHVNITSNNTPAIQKQKTEDQMTLVNNSKTKFHKHACSQCNKRFSTKQKLHRHMWIHRKKTFTCEICACSFEKQEELDSHRLSTHQGNSAYVCNECGKCFSSRQGLWEHNRVHGATSHLYKCMECSKTFSSRQGYLIHKRAHNDERPYGCRFCWKSFRDGGTLRKHERIHTGERPHACPLCTRAFNQKVVLREHVRWLHAANWQPNTNGIYDCTLCDQKLTDKDDLCAHIVKHSDYLALLAKDASKNNIKVLSNVTDGNKNKQNIKLYSNTKVKIEILPAISVNSNVLNVTEEVVTSTPLIECDLCGDKFLNKDDLTEHVRIHI